MILHRTEKQIMTKLYCLSQSIYINNKSKITFCELIFWIPDPKENKGSLRTELLSVSGLILIEFSRLESIRFTLPFTNTSLCKGSLASDRPVTTASFEGKDCKDGLS